MVNVPGQRTVDAVIEEIVELRRLGFRFIALADDNFYPVTLDDLAKAARRQDKGRLEQLTAMRAERFELMAQLARLPDDMVFFTQITMEAAEDTAFLDAMNRANIKGALVGVESVTPEGLKDVHKGFNLSGEQLVDRLRSFKRHGVPVLASFIFGLPSDRPATFELTAKLAERSGSTFAQFVMLTPFPGTVDFAAWEKSMEADPTRIEGIPLTRHWLIPKGQAAQGLRSPPAHVGRRNSRAHSGRLGSFLQLAEHLGPRQVRPDAEGTHRVRADFEALSPDVRQHGHCNRQRADQSIRELGSVDREAVPEALRCAAHAGTSVPASAAAGPAGRQRLDTGAAVGW